MMVVDIHTYHIKSGTWSKETNFISVEMNHFAKGGMRHAHHGYRWTDRTRIVIKKDRGKDFNRTDVENDVRTQMRCKFLADKYNQNPVTPKKVT